MDLAKKVYFSFADNKVPEGVKEITKLGGGYGVGFKASELKVVLYDSEGLLAHVELEPHDTVLVLHTRTDRGNAGGMGYMKLLFPVTLRLIREHFFTKCTEINMTPAPGAATKGLVSLLCQLVSCIPVPKPLSTRQSMMLTWSKTMRSKAESLRKARQSKPKKELAAQQWDPTLMQETVYELACLDGLEVIHGSGLWIIGNSTGFAATVVGTSVLGRAAHDACQQWHQHASKDAPGTLLLGFPMASLDVYIQALEVLTKTF